MKIFILYRTDAWHSTDSKELLGVFSTINKCYWAAHWKGATDEQVGQMKTLG